MLDLHQRFRIIENLKKYGKRKQKMSNKKRKRENDDF
jgi:hypothetical protein